jgi:hypothetical protein
MAMLSVKTRAQLLDAQRASTERKAPSLPALLAILHERANQSGSATTEALVALAERALQREAGLDEPQAALRLLFALAGSAPAPASSRALGAAVHRAQQRFVGDNMAAINYTRSALLLARWAELAAFSDVIFRSHVGNLPSSSVQVCVVRGWLVGASAMVLPW